MNAQRLPLSARIGGRSVWAVILVAGLILSHGCSRTRLAYHFSDWFLLHSIDGYFDLHADQEKFLDEKIVRLQAWHRRVELPALVRSLRELETRYRDGLSIDDAEWIEFQYREIWHRLLAHGLADFSAFLTTVDDEQIQTLQSQMKERNEWMVRQTTMNDPELKEDILKWLFEFLEGWYGDLRPDQRDTIRSWVHPDREWVVLKLQNRQQWQQDFVTLLQAHPPSQDIQAKLDQWVLTPSSRWTPEYKRRWQLKKSEWKQLLVRVDALMTEEQKQHVLERVRNYRKDFEQLAGES